MKITIREVIRSVRELARLSCSCPSAIVRRRLRCDEVTQLVKVVAQLLYRASELLDCRRHVYIEHLEKVVMAPARIPDVRVGELRDLIKQLSTVPPIDARIM